MEQGEEWQELRQAGSSKVTVKLKEGAMEGGKLLRHKLAGMDDMPSFPSWRNHLYT